MIKAIGSRIYIENDDNQIAINYYDCIRDIISSDVVNHLSDFNHHINVTRLQHSINVSYYSFLFCNKFGLNARAAARGGLLHDLFFYSIKDEKLGTKHISFHPKKALQNAETVFNLTNMEKDIIVKHMWPISLGNPKYKESLIVSCIDKYCATCEILDYWRQSIMRKSKKILASATK